MTEESVCLSDGTVISKTEYTVLLLLKRRGPVEGYRVWRARKPHRRPVFKQALNGLVSRGLVSGRFAAEPRSAVPMYELTERGAELVDAATHHAA